MDAIEMEGLEAYFIHGTKYAHGFSWPNLSGKSFNESLIKGVGEYLGNELINQDFNWSGENDDASRHKAARELAEHVNKTRKTGEPISLIGHSHGGNIAIMAVNILIDEFKMNPNEIKIVALNTPQENDISLKHYGVDLFVVNANGDLIQQFGGDKGNGSDVLHGDAYITYDDQYDDDYIETDHFGTGQENAKLWMPMLEKEVKALQKRREEPCPIDVKIDIKERRDNTGTKYEKK